MKKRLSRLTSAIVALAIGLATVVGVALLVTVPEPTLHVEGMELRNVLNSDGTTSIQALVKVYASDMPTLTSGAMVVEYNRKYWVPSRMSDNTQYELPVDGGSVLEATFFETNPDLYGGTTDPFLFDGKETPVRTQIDLQNGVLALGFNLKPENDLPDIDGDKIEKYTWDYGTANITTYMCINAEEKTLLGTLSFWVDPDYLEEMTTKADPFEENTGFTKADLTSANPPESDFMLPTVNVSDTNITTNYNITAWTANYWDISDKEEIRERTYDNAQDADTITSYFHTKYQIPDVIVRAEAAEKDVEINAYQAYTDASPADIAAALTRYSSAVRVTYPSGAQRDEAMFWGKDVMTIVDNNSGNVYEFQYDGSAPDGYTFTRISGTGNPDPKDDYDPTHGSYTVTQPYHYVEDGENKTYPSPIRVNLTVTPVTVIGFTADDLKKTYKINDPELPDECDKLQLPEEGKLVFDTVLSGTIPAMPLTTWTNNSVSLTPTTAMNTLTDVGGAVTWPTTQAEIDSNTGVGDYEFTCADPTQAAIRQAHPWATVTAGYTVTATRTILPDSAEIPEYIVEADVNDSAGIQIIQVRRRDGQPMQFSTFEVYRPDGTYVDPSWFNSNTAMIDNGGAHTVMPNGTTEYLIYTDPGASPVYPGNPTDDPAERETTRRHINLGGYFTVVVNESGYGKSDPIRAYQRRRQNVYLYHYNIPEGGTLNANSRFEFDFTGKKAGLYPFHTYSTLPNTVVLPFDCGYIVHTRYDGVTGAEPGEVRTFTVNSWSASAAPSGATAPNWTAGDIVTHGPSQFSDRSYASGFGMVENGLSPKREVKMLVEVDDETLPPTEGLTLTYEGAPAPSNILKHGNGEVAKVVFDTVQEGYGYKQEFELTLTNTGTTDIHGIYIDTLLGPQNDPTGKQHFEIIKPPATDLAPGASTTFIITYVLGLEKSTDLLPEKTYVDNIHIGTAGGAAKDFIARFKVVDGALYKLLVQPRPEDGSMGTGGAVTGVVSGIYDPTPVGSKLMETDPVWVLVTPLDEYAIKELTPGVPEVYYIDGGLKVYLTPYTPTGSSDKPAAGEFLFQLPGGMPPHDTTIYVDFEEPIPSKLRLSDLKAYADENESSCITQPNEQIMYDMTDPTYGTTGFDQDHTDYLVVIPADADFSGLELTLYNIIATHEVIGAPYSTDTPVLNAVIEPDVKIQLDDIGNTVVLDEKGNVGNVADGMYPLPSVHQVTFQSPDPGKAKTATITITYYDGSTLYERTEKYKVKFVRRTEVPVHTFAYGNTPYGMIMNAQNIAGSDKETAKESYAANDRFTDPLYTPTKARVAGEELTSYVYWPEAWEGEAPNWPEDWGERNLDRNDYALVVYVGEAFEDPGIKVLLDSTGKKVINQTLKRSVEVVLLDDNGTTVTGVTNPADNTNADRFNGTETTVIDLDDLQVNSGGIAPLMRLETLVDWEATNGRTIRPGIYALQYEFEDFDGAKRSFTRPLVVLRNLGDIDAYNGTDDDDADYIHRRFTSFPMLADIIEVVNYPDWDKTLYRYRICDVNNDRNINNIDANRIQNEAALTDFYRPVDYIG